jgi:hypothetical protein
LREAVEPCGGEFSVREAAGMRQLAQDTATRRSGTPRWLVVGSTRRAGDAGSGYAGSGGWWHCSEGTGPLAPRRMEGLASARPGFAGASLR